MLNRYGGVIGVQKDQVTEVEEKFVGGKGGDGLCRKNTQEDY